MYVSTSSSSRDNLLRALGERESADGCYDEVCGVVKKTLLQNKHCSRGIM